MDGAGQKGSRKEGSKSRTEAQFIGYDHHAEEDAERGDYEHLVIHVFDCLIQEGGKEEYTQDQPDHKVEDHEAQLSRHRCS